jgi:hypothetical protein
MCLSSKVPPSESKPELGSFRNFVFFISMIKLSIRDHFYLVGCSLVLFLVTVTGNCLAIRGRDRRSIDKHKRRRMEVGLVRIKPISGNN